MKKNRIIAAVLGAATLLTLTLTGCSGGHAAKNPDPAQITDKLQSELKLPEMIKVTDARLAKYYSLPQGAVKRSSVYICSSSASSAEIAVFEASDAGSVQKVKDAVSNRREQKADIFRNYGAPKEYGNIQNCILETKGNYVLFAVTDDSAAAKKTMESFF